MFNKKEYAKKYRLENKEKIKQSAKEYRLKNLKEYKIRQRASYLRNKKRRQEYYKKYYLENKKRLKEYRIENKDVIKKRTKIWNANNRKHINEYVKAKNKSDVHFHLKRNISSLIRRKLRNRLLSKNRKSTWDFLPYTIDELKEHLERLFSKGMTWNNYGEWHIDHKISDCNFSYINVNDKEFQECWALENLQLLWAMDNFRKNKYVSIS